MNILNNLIYRTYDFFKNTDHNLQQTRRIQNLKKLVKKQKKMLVSQEKFISNINVTNKFKNLNYLQNFSESFFFNQNYLKDSVNYEWSMSYFKDLLSNFIKDYNINSYNKNKNINSTLEISHDCDWHIDNSLFMASLENKYDIKSTYYLLNPDGFTKSHNYFGYIENKKFLIDEKLFDIAKNLLDLGHEVGFHNDLITLGLFLKKQPGELLDFILNEFTKRNINITNIKSHGSIICKKFKYINYELFHEFNKDIKNSFVVDNFKINKLSMKDYGLNHDPDLKQKEKYYDLYLTDSRNEFNIIYKNDNNKFLKERFYSKNTSKVPFLIFLKKVLINLDKKKYKKIHFLIHPDHWASIIDSNFIKNFNVIKSNYQKVDDINHKSNNSKNFFSKTNNNNIIYQNENKEFENYNNIYGTKENIFPIANAIIKEIKKNQIFLNLKNILEVGCGTGDFLFDLFLNAREPDKFIGIDGSSKAIKIAANNYNNLYFVNDKVENFVENYFTNQFFQNINIDSLIDKNGTTFMKDKTVIKNYMSNVNKILGSNGKYIFISNYNFQNTLQKTRKKNETTVFEYCLSYFTKQINLDTKKNKNNNFYIIRIFSNQH